MTEFRLYLDEDATANSLLRGLRNRGMNVTSTIEKGLLGQTDEKQLEWAFRHQRIIYSFNTRDFYRIHSEWVSSGRSHSGIVLGRQEYSIGDQMRGLLRLAAAKSAENMESTVEFLGIWIR